jgi:uncharacterized membrane protein YhaH (DUF805 family)
MDRYLDYYLGNYSNFSGRASRREYWYFTLLYFYFALLLAIGGGFLDPSAPMGLILVAYLLLSYVPFLAVSVRRLHDIGKSSYFYLLNFLPLGGIVLFVFMLTKSDPTVNKYGAPKSHLVVA